MNSLGPYEAVALFKSVSRVCVFVRVHVTRSQILTTKHARSVFHARKSVDKFGSKQANDRIILLIDRTHCLKWNYVD